MNFEKSTYWEEQYLKSRIGWDIGNISTPIKEYVDQIFDKNIKILVPGAGNAYEVQYFFENGFYNVFILDFAQKPIKNFLERVPNFPKNQIFVEDFFSHKGHYDLIIEHTFFSALPLKKRNLYVEKMNELLNEKGLLVGLFFCKDFGSPFPPFGGTYEEYTSLFSKNFHIKKLEIAYNSIKPRKNNELFFIFEKKIK